MKIKLDENLPRSLKPLLQLLGHDVQTVYDESLQGKDDAEVWEAAATEHRLLITQDLQFGNLRQYPLGSHAGILLLRLREPNRESVERIIKEIFQRETVEQWEGALIVASEHRLRVLKPEEA